MVPDISCLKLMLVCSHSKPADLGAFADHLAQNYTPNTVIIDATASDVPPAHYLEWMQRGIHVITPNKKLNSGLQTSCTGSVQAAMLGGAMQIE